LLRDARLFQPTPAVSALETLLARADRIELPRADYTPAPGGLFEARVFTLFNIAVEMGTDLPVAAVTRVADGSKWSGERDNAWWLRADPVYLQPQGGGLVLYAGPDLGLTQEQSRALVDEILQVFAADGWTLEAPTPQRWYLRLATPPDIQTSALACVIGRDIHPHLPAGKDAPAWHVVLNEIQILLHTSGVNVERESRGLAPINSLWFWGGGRQPSVPAVNWTQIWSHEPLSRGLAQLASIALMPLPADATHWLAQATAGLHLLVLEPEVLMSGEQDPDVWQEFMARMEQGWIAPLVSAVKTGELHSITLYAERGPGFRITRKTLGRWWRRRHPLSHYG
jgi:hypothetical protein